MTVMPPLTPTALRQRCQQGVVLLQQGDAAAALEAFNLVLRAAEAQKVSMPDLHVCLCNRSAVLLGLGRAEDALQDALLALRKIEGSAAGCVSACTPACSQSVMQCTPSACACQL